MKDIIILGSGMAGFGAGHALAEEGIKATIYEGMPYYGGHTASVTYKEGFVFDQGPHVSFTKDTRIQKLFAGSVHNEYETVAYDVNNYWKGHWIKHPAHCNLHGLPPNLVVEIVEDFVRVQRDVVQQPRNYEEWLIATYGESFARTFPMEYTAKYHTTAARNMTTDWIGPRMYRPSLKEVLLGCLTPATPNVHYVTDFRYPRRNGFMSFLNGFLQEADLKLGHEAVSINHRKKEIRFANGSTGRYDALVSSVPLPELIRIIDGVPADVADAAARLACSSCLAINVGVDRPDITQAHVSYFYDRDVIFTRLSFPHLMSPHNVPPGCGSIQAEIYFSKKYMELKQSPEECIGAVIADLRRCGILHEQDRILFSSHMLIPYANVIFDLDRAGALAIVHGFLDDIGIDYCGRYGKWEYIWTDEAFISGEEAARNALKRPC